MSHMIPYENLQILNRPFEEELKAKFALFLEKGWYIMGEELSLFEQEFSAYHSAGYTVGVANGLDALILSIKCCGFADGSEIIVPSNTYIATILAVIHCGMVPVLAEPDPRTYNISPAAVAAAVTSKTVAVLVVHLYGRCCEMDPIMAIAAQHELKVIEDCAQAHGAKYKGQLAGTFGDFGAFSFYPTKNLGALGDAGAIICRTETHYHKLRQLRNYGSAQKYHNKVVGYNSRLDELQASFLRVKLPYLDKINAHKRKLAGLYNTMLKPGFVKPLEHADYDHVYHIYNILHTERDRLKQYLLDHQVMTEIHYPVAPQEQQALQSYLQKYDYPVSALIHKNTLSLPCSFAHTEEEIIRVIAILNEFE